MYFIHSFNNDWRLTIKNIQGTVDTHLRTNTLFKGIHEYIILQCEEIQRLNENTYVSEEKHTLMKWYAVRVVFEEITGNIKYLFSGHIMHG